MPRLHEVITHLSHGGSVFVNLLAPNDASELSRLCDAVAAENGHTWRWQRSAEVPKPAENLAASGGGAGAEQLVAPTEDRLRAQK